MPVSSSNIPAETVTATLTPATAGALTTDSRYTLTTPTIPATALRVYIKNVGATIEGGAMADIIVNGTDNVAVGEFRLFEARLDPVINTFKYLSALAITNASGAGIYFEIDS